MNTKTDRMTSIIGLFTVVLSAIVCWSEVNQQMSFLESERRALREEIARIKELLNESQKREETYVVDQTEVRKRVSDFGERLAEADIEHDTLQDDFAGLRQNADETQKRQAVIAAGQAQSEVRIDELEGLLAGASAELGALHEEIEGIKHQSGHMIRACDTGSPESAMANPRGPARRTKSTSKGILAEVFVFGIMAIATLVYLTTHIARRKELVASVRRHLSNRRSSRHCVSIHDVPKHLEDDTDTLTGRALGRS